MSVALDGPVRALLDAIAAPAARADVDLPALGRAIEEARAPCVSASSETRQTTRNV